LVARFYKEGLLSASLFSIFCREIGGGEGDPEQHDV